jgi:hypothetical protein
LCKAEAQCACGGKQNLEECFEFHGRLMVVAVDGSQYRKQMTVSTANTSYKYEIHVSNDL